MVVTSVLLVLSICCHFVFFDSVCSPRVRLYFNLMDNLALLTMQQHRDMATLHSHYDLLRCIDPRQRWTLASTYVSSHTHINTSVLTYPLAFHRPCSGNFPPLQGDAAANSRCTGECRMGTCVGDVHVCAYAPSASSQRFVAWHRSYLPRAPGHRHLQAQSWASRLQSHVQRSAAHHSSCVEPCV